MGLLNRAPAGFYGVSNPSRASAESPTLQTGVAQLEYHLLDNSVECEGVSCGHRFAGCEEVLCVQAAASGAWSLPTSDSRA